MYLYPSEADNNLSGYCAPKRGYSKRIASFGFYLKDSGNFLKKRKT